MRVLQSLIRIASAAALMSLCPSAFAQGVTWKLQCQSVGNSAPEPLGDREGHTISVLEYNCRTEGGPLDGAVLTGMSASEWDKGSANILSAQGIYRKPGGTAVFQHTEGKNTLIMADGKVTGWSGTGRGTYKLATGSAASLAGKGYSYSARSTGVGLFTVDVKAE